MVNRFLVLITSFLLFQTGCKPLLSLPDPEVERFHQRINFLSENGVYDISINQVHVGKTPVETDIWYYPSDTLEILARPINSGSKALQIMLTVPPVPKKIIFDTEPKPVVTKSTKISEKTIEKQGAPQLKPSVSFVLPSIFFEVDKSIVKEDQNFNLLHIISMMDQDQGYNLAIHGYADDQGAEEYNIALSLLRAASVYDRLVELGADPARLEYFGHGEIYTIRQYGYILDYGFNRLVSFQLMDR